MRASGLHRAHRPAIAVPVVVFLFVGVACAVASSIVGVLMPGGGQHAPRQSARHDLPGGTVIYSSILRRPGYLLISITGPFEAGVADRLDEIRSQELPTLEGDPRPRWMRRPAMPDPQTSRGLAAGYPLVCFWGRVDGNVNERPQQVAIGIAELQMGGAVRSFPMRPIWGALAFNTAVYALAGLGCWYAAVYAFRGWRSWRGRCSNCGYPKRAGAAVCPECGMPLQPTAAGSS